MDKVEQIQLMFCAIVKVKQIQPMFSEKRCIMFKQINVCAHFKHGQFSHSNFIVDHLGLHKGSSVTEGFNCSKITRSSITFHFIPDY